MLDTLDIKVTKTSHSRISELDENNIPFGKIFSDHMFTAEYANGQWQNLRIEPYAPFSLSPAVSAIHYGQSVFEGMKAFRGHDGNIVVFRAKDNASRLNDSAKRMCMPEIPEELFMEALEALLKVDNAWIPGAPGTSLYIRPFMFATDDYIGIKPSDTYKFCIFTCPVGKYYSKPVRVKIETAYTRAAKGGVGAAKAAGNYAASLYPARLAQAKGYDQLVWTDAISHEYIEESGTMNIVFQIDGKLITPPSGDTILSGITRRSIVQLAKDNGIPVEERQVSVKEVVDAMKAGKLEDAFGAGTAATVAHIATIHHDGTDYDLRPIEEREISNKLAKHLMDIKRGNTEDKHGWNHIITV